MGFIYHLNREWGRTSQRSTSGRTNDFLEAKGAEGGGAGGGEKGTMEEQMIFRKDRWEIR